MSVLNTGVGSCAAAAASGSKRPRSDVLTKEEIRTSEVAARSMTASRPARSAEVEEAALSPKPRAVSLTIPKVLRTLSSLAEAMLLVEPGVTLVCHGLTQYLALVSFCCLTSESLQEKLAALECGYHIATIMKEEVSRREYVFKALGFCEGAAFEQQKFLTDLWGERLREVAPHLKTFDDPKTADEYDAAALKAESPEAFKALCDGEAVVPKSFVDNILDFCQVQSALKIPASIDFNKHPVVFCHQLLLKGEAALKEAKIDEASDFFSSVFEILSHYPGTNRLKLECLRLIVLSKEALLSVPFLHLEYFLEFCQETQSVEGLEFIALHTMAPTFSRLMARRFLTEAYCGTGKDHSVILESLSQEAGLLETLFDRDLKDDDVFTPEVVASLKTHMKREEASIGRTAASGRLCLPGFQLALLYLGYFSMKSCIDRKDEAAALKVYQSLQTTFRAILPKCPAKLKAALNLLSGSLLLRMGFSRWEKPLYRLFEKLASDGEMSEFNVVTSVAAARGDSFSGALDDLFKRLFNNIAEFKLSHFQESGLEYLKTNKARGFSSAFPYKEIGNYCFESENIEGLRFVLEYPEIPTHDRLLIQRMLVDLYSRKGDERRLAALEEERKIMGDLLKITEDSGQKKRLEFWRKKNFYALLICYSDEGETNKTLRLIEDFLENKGPEKLQFDNSQMKKINQFKALALIECVEGEECELIAEELIALYEKEEYVAMKFRIAEALATYYNDVICLKKLDGSDGDEEEYDLVKKYCDEVARLDLSKESPSLLKRWEQFMADRIIREEA